MVCQSCKKNVATVHITDIVESEKIERHLCESCAQEHGVTLKSVPPLNELLTNFVLQQSGANKIEDVRCDTCGMSFAEFRTKGLLGCPNDYDVFEKLLSPLIAQAHENATHHVGRIPGTRPVEEIREHEQVRVERELEAAVAREDYETAARLRDELNTLRSATGDSV